MGPGAHARPRGDPRGAQDEENTPMSSNRDGASRRSEDRGPRPLLARGGRDSSPGVVQSAVNRRQCRHGPRGEARSRRLREKWQTNDEYYANLNKVLDLKPDLVIDDGADLVKLLHTKRTEL